MLYGQPALDFLVLGCVWINFGKNCLYDTSFCEQQFLTVDEQNALFVPF